MKSLNEFKSRGTIGSMSLILAWFLTSLPFAFASFLLISFSSGLDSPSSIPGVPASVGFPIAIITTFLLIGVIDQYTPK